MQKVLIIDDDQITLNIFSAMVNNMGCQAHCSSTLAEGLQKVLCEYFDIVLLDIRLPDGNGLEALPEIHRVASAPEIIIITGYGSLDGAELAIKNGAWDYIEKGASIEKITLTLKRALSYHEEKKRVTAPAVIIQRERIIGNSAPIRDCLEQLAHAAMSDVNVLLTGETGTGKELFARAIHENSHRSQKKFVTVDCAALPEALVENILFGHEKGAYTGADKFAEGLIKQAHGGTLFLDEVGELPLTIQQKFLRVLQEQRFCQLGAAREVESDFRVVAATNRNLKNMAERKEFRRDLFFRLSAFHIEIPPLRERREDIREIFIHYASRCCEQYGLATKGFSPDFLSMLYSYNWPGNVRELLNAVEKAILVARYEPILFSKHLPINIRVQLAQDSLNSKAIAHDESTAIAANGAFPTLQEFRAKEMIQLEKQYLADLMTVSKNDKEKACRLAGLSRSRLYGLLKKNSVHH